MPTMKSTKMFDYLVIGGGSGGIASARRAAQHGAKVAVIERGRKNAGAGLGGTCVNFGCVPKKVMFNTAMHAEMLHTAKEYGFENVPEKPTFNWNLLKQKRDAYVTRLNGIYETNLGKANIEHVEGVATFCDDKVVDVNGQKYSGKHILIAVGGYPSMPDIPGIEHCISSDGFFHLETQPKKVAVVGAGYIATELAGRFSF